MGRFRENMDDGDEAAIDMSPLIDCVFILLIFFIVTTTFVEEAGIPAVRPDSSAAPSQSDEESKTVVFRVTRDGAVMFEGQDIGMQGVGPTVSRRMQREQVPVVVLAERGAKTGWMLNVLDLAAAEGADDISVDSVD